MKTISWTPEKLKSFKEIYSNNQDKQTFLFEKNEFFVPYAKYLIEYLESKFYEK